MKKIVLKNKLLKNIYRQSMKKDNEGYLRIVVYFKHIVKLDYPRMVELFMYIIFPKCMSENEKIKMF